MKPFAFPKTSRLVRNSQFKAVLARNLRASNGLFTLFVAENHRGLPRLGVSVSKSCGGAVIRNRLKRLTREAFRRCQSQIPSGFDYLLMISAKGSKESGKKHEDKQLLKSLTLEQVNASFLKLAAGAVALGARARTPAGGAADNRGEG
ncbi:MAG: ribonuclease P protein component [Planctomycetota bacterium]